MSSAAARRQYSRDGTGVVSNQRLLVMLFERLDRDLAQASSQCALGDRAGSHDAIVHAQDILYELIGALDTGVWDGAEGLQEVYVFCVNELIAANMAQDPARIDNCRVLLQPIGQAWREVHTDGASQTAPQASVG